MTKLDDFSAAGFRLTWKLLDVGFKRCRYFAGSLTEKVIVEYAQTLLGTVEDEQVLLLASEVDGDSERIDRRLRLLAEQENTFYETEYRKWRVLYVRDNLPRDDGIDHITGLIQLLDIWAKFDFPDDSPHIIQGRDNNILPQDYYTEDNYRMLLKRNEVWVEKEISEIRAAEERRRERGKCLTHLCEW
jgi:hypothetical protein